MDTGGIRRAVLGRNLRSPESCDFLDGIERQTATVLTLLLDINKGGRGPGPIRGWKGSACADLLQHPESFSSRSLIDDESSVIGSPIQNNCLIYLRSDVDNQYLLM